MLRRTIHASSRAAMTGHRDAYASLRRSHNAPDKLAAESPGGLDDRHAVGSDVRWDACFPLGSFRPGQRQQMRTAQLQALTNKDLGAPQRR